MEMADFPWNGFLFGAAGALAGFGLLALNSLCSPAVRRHGKRAHFVVGFLVNGVGMTLIVASSLWLATLAPRLDWEPLLFLGAVAAAAGAALYGASATRVGRLRPLSDYTIELDVEGFYAIVRHPQALAMSLLAIGLGGLMPSLAYLALLPILIAGWYLYSWLEEELELVPVFAERYREYSRVTPRMIPSPGALADWIVERVAVGRSLAPKRGSEERR
jgi:protein-S-isoprenylcysteine O-methyltransferase Ste14